MSGPLPADELRRIDAYWRAANYLSVGQIYLLANPVERPGAVEMVVADDGRGFDPEAPRSGFGLSGMRERVELLGGELEITSSPDGTRVTAALPVRGST